jgi:hypothetical protein
MDYTPFLNMKYLSLQLSTHVSFHANLRCIFSFIMRRSNSMLNVFLIKYHSTYLREQCNFQYERKKVVCNMSCCYSHDVHLTTVTRCVN